MMFNDIAKKLTGIDTDLIKPSNITPSSGAASDANKPATSSYAQQKEQEQAGRFKLGGGGAIAGTNSSGGKKKGGDKKKCC